MTALLIIGTVAAIIAYICMAVKIGLWVGDRTTNTGFDWGFYAITTVTILAIPFAIAEQVRP
jgi:bacteriorhodopsin